MVLPLPSMQSPTSGPHVGSSRPLLDSFASSPTIHLQQVLPPPHFLRLRSPHHGGRRYRPRRRGQCLHSAWRRVAVANRGTDAEAGASQGQAPIGRRMPLPDGISAPLRRSSWTCSTVRRLRAWARAPPPCASLSAASRYTHVLFLRAGHSRCGSRVPCA
jgi:hypothetical protein